MPVLDNEDHERFCQQFRLDFDGKRAMVASGFAEPSDNGLRLLERPEVRERLRELTADSYAKIKATADTVVQELNRIASSDLGEAFDEKNCLKDLKDIPIDIRRCIASIEVDEIWEGYGENRTQIGVTKKIKLWDKNKGLEMLGKYFKLFTDKLELGVGTLEDMLSGTWGKDKNGQIPENT